MGFIISIVRFGKKNSVLLLVPLLFGILVCVSCSKKEQEEVFSQTSETAQSRAAVHADLIIEPSAVPLWLEFRNKGLAQIADIGDADLKNFEPWPYMQHITGMLSFGEGLAAFVNRLGFIRVEPLGDEGGLLAVSLSAVENYFPRWSASMPFSYEGCPTVILSRDDFFSAEKTEGPAVQLRSWMIKPDAEKALPVRIPALNTFSDSDGWDIKDFFTTESGYYFFKALCKTDDEKKILYYSSLDLGGSGTIQEISFSSFMQTSSPVHFSNAPPLIEAALKEAFETGAGNESHIATMYQSASGAKQQYIDRAPAEVDGDYSIIEFTGVSGSVRDAAQGEQRQYALVLNSSGTMVIAQETEAGEGGTGGDTRIVTQRKKMPSLPEGFVYTAAFVCGNTMIAAWEERQDWNIGAAGLLFIRSNFIFTNRQ